MIDGFDEQKDLQSLDLSFNLIKKLEGLNGLTKLRFLYLVENRISIMENLGILRNLTILELGGNRIRVCVFPVTFALSFNEICSAIF